VTHSVMSSPHRSDARDQRHVWRSLIRAESIDLLLSSQQRKDDDGQSDERNDERPHRRDGTGETPRNDEADGQPEAMSEGKHSEQDHCSTADKRPEPEWDSAVSRDNRASSFSDARDDVEHPEEHRQDVGEPSPCHASMMTANGRRQHSHVICRTSAMDTCKSAIRHDGAFLVAEWRRIDAGPSPPDRRHDRIAFLRC